MPGPARKPSSLAVTLQGQPATATRTLFLLPDGSGSGMAYARLPRLSNSDATDVCLCGVNSPMLGAGPFEPDATTIETLATGFVAAIRATQPRGPYYVGGWSAGGFFATEVARLLLRAGDAVAAVVLIDSPCRLEFGALPFPVVERLFARNLTGGTSAAGARAKPMPAWMADHFGGVLKAVERYAPARIEGRVPDVFVIEASEGIYGTWTEAVGAGFENSDKVTRLLLGPRSRLVEPQGWDRIYPDARIRCARSPGNHFTMMQPPHVSPSCHPDLDCFAHTLAVPTAISPNHRALLTCYAARANR